MSQPLTARARAQVRVIVGLSAAAVALLSSSTAFASPEWNLGVGAGVAGRSRDSAVWQGTAFYGSLRGDILWNRRRWGDVGIGPSLEIGTVAFSDARLHVGASLLAPVGSLFSLMVTPAAYGRVANGEAAGASGRVFFGFRSLNYYGSYAMGSGLLVGIDQDLEGGHSRALVVAAQVDGALLAIPFILLVSWIRGAPSS